MEELGVQQRALWYLDEIVELNLGVLSKQDLNNEKMRKEGFEQTRY